jgi:hypothetical protein
MKDLQILKAACDAVLADPKLLPVKDAAGNIVETHCNFGAIRVANAVGCHELDGKMADQQYTTMDDNASGLWLKVTGDAATAFAQLGGLAFACASSKMLGEAHGHIAAVYPAPMQFSGSLGKNVPVVANIGKTDTEEAESRAFPVAKGEPSYFVWNG